MNNNAQAIYEKFYKPLMNYTVHYCGDSNMAKDVVGKVFSMLFEKHEFPEDVRAWIFANAKFEAYHAIHQVSKFAPEELAANKPDSPDLRPVEEDFIERETIEQKHLLKLQILSLVEKLIPRQRQAFNLRLIENQGVLAAAKNMGVSHTTVQYHLDRAIANIRSDLGIDVQKETGRCTYGACKKERTYRSNFCENHMRISRNITHRRYHRRMAGWS